MMFPHVSVYLYMYMSIPDIGLAVRVFANRPGDLGSFPGRVIPKTQKMVLDASLLNTQHYKVRVKWSNPRKGVVPFPTPWCSSCRKGSLRVTFDYGHRLYLLYMSIQQMQSMLSMKETRRLLLYLSLSRILPFVS